MAVPTGSSGVRSSAFLTELDKALDVVYRRFKKGDPSEGKPADETVAAAQSRLPTRPTAARPLMVVRTSSAGRPSVAAGSTAEEKTETVVLGGSRRSLPANRAYAPAAGAVAASAAAASDPRVRSIPTRHQRTISFGGEDLPLPAVDAAPAAAASSSAPRERVPLTLEQIRGTDRLNLPSFTGPKPRVQYWPVQGYPNLYTDMPPGTYNPRPR